MWCPFVFVFAYLLTADYEQNPHRPSDAPNSSDSTNLAANGGFEQWERNDVASQKWWEKKNTSKMMISPFV